MTTKVEWSNMANRFDYVEVVSEPDLDDGLYWLRLRTGDSVFYLTGIATNLEEVIARGERVAKAIGF